jgi:predicted RNase H-like nuclease
LTDQMAGACSPMMLYGVPVGKMFFEGAPRIERSGASVWPCRPNSSGRTVLEGYPALVVRHLMGKTSYKSDKSKQASQRDHRRQIVEKCQSPGQLRDYDMSLRFSAELESCLIEDSTGDSLDAVLCAIQAAAYWLQPSEPCTNLAEANATEGWIVDPTYAIHF